MEEGSSPKANSNQFNRNHSNSNRYAQSRSYGNGRRYDRQWSKDKKDTASETVAGDSPNDQPNPADPVQTLLNCIVDPKPKTKFKSDQVQNKPNKSREEDSESKTDRRSKEDQKWQCVVCCQQYRRDDPNAVYAIGPCDHLVCFKCSTKMRVLCEQFECPICRQPIPEVIFTQNRDLKFSRLETRKCVQYNSLYKIFFSNKFCLNAFNKLLEHRCQICNRDDAIFDVLEELEVHLKREHDVFLCELCVAHLKIFSSERQYYTRRNLQKHKDSGDPENRSHRGHPLCELCNHRYMDDDDLIRHLRRDHFFCHFCVDDGPNEFYDTYDRLREHFREKHFLCEEGGCREERFTSVFRNEIDLQAHFTQVHCTSKHDLKNARTIRLDLNIQRNSLNSGSTSIGLQSTNRGDRRFRNNHDRELQDIATNAPTVASASQSLPRMEDFPELPISQTSDNPALPIASNSNSFASFVSTKKKPSKPVNSFSSRFNESTRAMEDFPELAPSIGSETPSFLKRTVPAKNKSTLKYQNYRNDVRQDQASTSQVGTINRYADISANGIQGKASLREDEFPGLPSIVIKKSKKAKKQAKQTKLDKVNQKEAEDLAAAIDASLSSFSAFTNVEKTQADKKTSKPEAVQPSTSQADFPTISETNPSKKMLSLKVPPGLTKITTQLSGVVAPPPPGYTSNVDTFQETLGSLAQQLVTGSLPPVDKSEGQSQEQIKPEEQIKPTNQLTNNNEKSESHKSNRYKSQKGANHNNSNRFTAFIFPADFDSRNVELFRLIKQNLKDDLALETFKNITEAFRQNQIEANNYYRKCIDLFGKTKFLAIFPELLALMPHIGKQNELLSAYEKNFNLSKSSTTKKVTSGQSKGVLTIRNDERIDFLVCPKCRQVLSKKDGPEHVANH